MLDYKIYVLDQDGRIFLVHDFKGSDDLSAFEESKRYSDVCGVEIWQQARLVARIDQRGEAAAG